MSWHLLEQFHGHLGVLAAAAMIHPAVQLWRGLPLTRGGRYALGGALGLLALTFALGLVIYPAYRDSVKSRVFLSDATMGLLFETKSTSLLSHSPVEFWVGSPHSLRLVIKDRHAA